MRSLRGELTLRVTLREGGEQLPEGSRNSIDSTRQETARFSGSLWSWQSVVTDLTSNEMRLSTPQREEHSMWDSVNSTWIPFNQPLEGRLPFMYLDTSNFVTTGMGNLLEPRSTAEALPWYDQNTGDTASIDEIDEAWNLVKSRTDLSQLGGGAFKSVTSLRLTDSAIDDLIFSKLFEMERYLERRPPFRDFQKWPADAQLGLLSMSWGMGPAFNFPRFQTYASQRRWAEAATECRFNPDVGTIKIRNDRNQQLFKNAALVEELGLDPSELLWPARTPPSKEELDFVCRLEPDTAAEGSMGVLEAFVVEMQGPVDPPGFTTGLGGPNQGGHYGKPDWYERYGMDLGASTGTPVYAAFDGHVTRFKPHIPAQDHGGIYGAEIFMRHPNDKMGGFYTHITDVPASFQVGTHVARGDFLGNVVAFGGIPPHLHLALVEIIGSLPGAQYVGVNLYDLFLELETIYAEYYVPIEFMQDGTPPMPQWGRMQKPSAQPSAQTSREYEPD
jgi:Peptidase family M23